MKEQSRTWEKDTAYLNEISDIQDHPFVESLAIFKQHVNGNRLTHSYLVSYYSYRLARKLGWDARACARAGLLHDLFYYYPGDVSFSNGGHLRNHPKIALINARLVTDLTPIEEDIILKHMWLATTALPKYKESYIVTFVDKYVAMYDFIQPSYAKMMAAFKIFLKRLVLPALKLAGTKKSSEKLRLEIENSLQELDNNE